MALHVKQKEIPERKATRSGGEGEGSMVTATNAA